MAFTEKLKEKTRKRAHYTCCICQQPSMSLEVHHIIPQADNGPDTEDNAVLLCSNCHGDFGGNPEKRKQVTERRDWWYEMCEKKVTPDPEWVKLTDKLADSPTKSDLQNLSHQIKHTLDFIMNQEGKPAYQIVNETSSFAQTLGTASRPGSTPGQCENCGSRFYADPAFINSAICAYCGHDQTT